MISRRRGADQCSGLQIIVRTLHGEELLTANATPKTTVLDLKDFVATELSLFPFGFDLITLDGSMLDAAAELGQYPIPDNILETSMVKRNLPRTSSSSFLRIQSSVPEDAKPTFQGKQDSSSLLRDILLPRSSLVLAVLFVVFYCELSFIVCVTLAYAAYLVEALGFNPSSRALRHMSDANSLITYIAQMKAARPVPTIEASCWHWESRTRTVTDSDARQGTETYQEKVNTQTFTESLPVGRWRDNSGDVVEGVAYFPLLQIHFEIEWHPGDEETVTTYQASHQALHHRADAHDQHHDFEECLCLSDAAGTRPGLPHTDMMCTTRGCTPTWLGWKQYVIISSLGLSWPYRWWLARHSIKGDFVFRKQVWSHNREPADDDRQRLH